MGEHGKSIGKELDVVTGNEYNLEGKVEKTFETTYGYVEEMNILNSGGTITKKVLWNPTHGIIGDTLEAGVDKVSAWISPLVPQGAKYISSGNAKQLSKMKEENPNKFDGTVYHSQATLIDIASNNNLIADGKGGVLKHTNSFYTGAAGNIAYAQGRFEKYGLNLEGLTNIGDPVGMGLGLNSANAKGKGHSGYNKYMIFDKKTGLYINKYREKVSIPKYSNIEKSTKKGFLETMKETWTGGERK